MQRVGAVKSAKLGQSARSRTPSKSAGRELAPPTPPLRNGTERVITDPSRGRECGRVWGGGVGVWVGRVRIRQALHSFLSSGN